FLFTIHLPPSSTLFPYTTLFRSAPASRTLTIPRSPAHRRRSGISGERRPGPAVHLARGPSPGRSLPRRTLPSPLTTRRSSRPRQIGRHTSELQSRGHLVCRLLLE